MVGLIVSDVGSTLGTFDKPSTTDILHRLSGLPETEGKRRVVEEEARRFLHTAPTMSDEVIDGICGALLIDPYTWLQTWPGRFDAFDYTVDALTQLAEIAPVVALSNLSILCGPSRMDDLLDQCGDHLDGMYTSYGAGRRKPDPRLWIDLAAHYDVSPAKVVHIGDQWINDICGSVAAGARGIFLTRTSKTVPTIPGPRDWPASPDRIAVVDDLRNAVPVIQKWATE